MIQLDNLRFQFQYQSQAEDLQQAYRQAMAMNFNLNVRQGEKIAIIGDSGAGKSTLLNLIAGFIYADNYHDCQLILNHQQHNTSKPHQRPVSMLFQSNNLFDHLTVADNIGLGIKPNLKLSADEQHALKTVTQQVGLNGMLQRKPNQLSGGQQQRVALARCLLRNKPILLLDEPFSALDKGLREEMMILLNNICDEKNLTLLIVTHQPEELSEVIDEIFEIKNGEIIKV